MELCGQLGLCSSASELPLHTLLTEKVMQVLSIFGVSRDPPDSAVLLQIQMQGRGSLILHSFSSSIFVLPRLGMSFAGAAGWVAWGWVWRSSVMSHRLVLTGRGGDHTAVRDVPVRREDSREPPGEQRDGGEPHRCSPDMAGLAKGGGGGGSKEVGLALYLPSPGRSNW